MCVTEILPNFPRSFAQNLKVPAYGVQQDVGGHSTLVSKRGALQYSLAAITNVQEVNAGIRSGQMGFASASTCSRR